MYSLSFDAYRRLTLPVLAFNGLFFQNVVLRFFGGRIPTFGTNGPLWSLGNEFWYYIAFPLGMLAIAKGRTWWSRIACGASVVLMAWLSADGYVLLSIPWLMGAFIGSMPRLRENRPWIRRLIIASAAVLLGASLVFGRFASSAGVSDMLIGVTTAALIWVILQFAQSPLPRAYVVVARRSARCSYTVYLTHYPMIIFFKAIFHMPRAVPGWRSISLCLGLLAATLLYTQLLYELFEKHTDGVRNWIGAHLMSRNNLKRRVATQ